MSESSSQNCWVSEDYSQTNALCLGTGRFLRSVLVPTLLGAGLKPALIQTRGRSFMEYMDSRKDNTYQVDTVLSSGDIQTDDFPCWGAFSVGREQDRDSLINDILPKLNGISVLGIGVTEAGLSSKDTQAMQDLFSLFQAFQKLLIQDNVWSSRENKKLCVIDMDNVPNNGDKIRGYMQDLAADHPEMLTYFETRVSFMNTMVDRITSHRDGNTMIPKCEPMPAKALVVLDPNHDLPASFSKQSGVVVRSTKEDLDTDIALKLRIANGTHTAIAHPLALMKLLKTDVLSTDEPGSLLMVYLDRLVEKQIVPATANRSEANAVYEDWRRRLVHPHFGLSSFFITQSGPAKGGIRWGPTVVDLIQKRIQLDWTFAFAYAVLLRWLTPTAGSKATSGVSTGWLQGSVNSQQKVMKREIDGDKGGSVEYADGLRYHLGHGWYEFKCPLMHEGTPLTQMLQDCVGKSSNDCEEAVRAYLLSPEGGNLGAVKDDIGGLVKAIATLYVRMVTAGDSLERTLKEKSLGTKS